MEILKETEAYITELLEKKIPQTLTFHNINHTREVVEAAAKIAKKTELTEQETLVVMLAAWFHDSGFIVKCKGHEDESKIIAEKFLTSKNTDPQIIEDVLECIDATRIPQYPKSKTAKVLADADLFHLSQDYFFERTFIIREEWTRVQNRAIDERIYLEDTLMFFDMHEYQTKYGKKELSKGKKKNREVLEKKIKKLEEKEEKEKKELEEKVTKLENKISELRTPARGIETMFRVTGQNQISLSSIADNKSNILISVNAIIISVLGPAIIMNIEEKLKFIIPSVILLLVCLVTIIYAILATRPNVSSGKFDKQDIRDKKVNLLFFGNFYNMDVEQYEWALKEMMCDYDYLYGSLIKDQYYLGRVLGRKYSRLRTAYTIFMFGLIISVTSFIISIMADFIFTK